MKTLCLLLFSLSTLVGCGKNSMDSQTDTNSTVSTSTGSTTYTYLALGDSYTIGQSVPLSASFPYQLQAQLGTLNYTVANPNIIAVTGWTTQNLINGISQARITQQFSFVTLLIGVNNQYQGLSQTDYRTDFVQLLNTAIGYAGGNKNRVFVLSIPDYSVTPFAQGSDIATISSEIDQFNSINLDESTKAGVNYVNITDISRQAATDPTLIASDGLHPSQKMYALWVQRLTPLVAAQIK